MAKVSELEGRLLNHVELLYQRGERDLAVAFFELLGMDVVDTQVDNGEGTTILMVFPEPTDRHPMNNVLYLSEVRQAQWDLEEVLRDRIATDDELQGAVAAYDHKARTKPHGVTHFGLRYPSFADLEEVIDRIEHHLPAALAGRVAIDPVRPGDDRGFTGQLIQAFVRTDVACAGLFPFGQLIELQAQRSREEAASDVDGPAGR